MLLAAPPAGFATLVYSSTSDADFIRGAHAHRIDPAPKNKKSNGLAKPTYFYGEMLVPYPVLALGRHRARSHHLTSHLAAVRARVKEGIGTGTRTHRMYRPAPGQHASWRGKVVKLKRTAEPELRTPFALVLTSHKYSSHQMYQTIVPLLIADAHNVKTGDEVYIRRKWVESLLQNKGTAFVTSGRLALAVRHDKHIECWTSRTVDDDDLTEIESRIQTYLGL
jgi:hypothetical protein